MSGKPLGRKAYGSIPHLPGSKYGNREDKGVQPGMAKYFLETPVKGDIVYVTEKLDGCCVSVARLDNTLVPLTRSGLPCVDSKFEHHRLFAKWVEDNKQIFLDLLSDGERVVGEWLALAHGTKYNLVGRSPFAAFDLMVEDRRESYTRFFGRCMNAGVPTVPLIHTGGPVSIECVIAKLGPFGYYGAERPEGAVWRIERGGRFMAIAKYVCPYTNPGCMLPEYNGSGANIWNWHPGNMVGHEEPDA